MLPQNAQFRGLASGLCFMAILGSVGNLVKRLLRPMMFIVPSAVLGLLVGAYATFTNLHRQLVVMTNWSNSSQLLLPLIDDAWLLDHSNLSPTSLKQALLLQAYQSLQTAVCTRQLLRTPEQKQELARLVHQLSVSEAIHDPYWTAHFSKPANELFHGGLHQARRSLMMCRALLPTSQ